MKKLLLLIFLIFSSLQAWAVEEPANDVFTNGDQKGQVCDSGGDCATVNSEGRFDVVQHAHPIASQPNISYKRNTMPLQRHNKKLP